MLCSLLTILVLVILPEDDSQQTVMLMCSVTQLMGVSAVNSRIKDPAAVVIAAVEVTAPNQTGEFLQKLFSQNSKNVPFILQSNPGSRLQSSRV